MKRKNYKQIVNDYFFAMLYVIVDESLATKIVFVIINDLWTMRLLIF
jgi:hypothetical protein